LLLLSALALRVSQNKKRWLLLLLFVAGAGSVAMLALVTLGQSDALSSAWDYLDNALDITSPYRGIGSGLSGRTENWAVTIQLLQRGSWLWGEGYRAGNSLDLFIDNGYLVAWYELGIIPLILIAARYLALFSHAFQLHTDTKGNEAGWWAGLCLILAVFLTNNVVARYLFGMGNPFSLLGLFFLVATFHARSRIQLPRQSRSATEPVTS
jgi:exopolysaccharide production protein ExoQ